MKTVILCGGRGTRLGEHGKNLPKALVEIGGMPILWHILKTYSTAGTNDFVLCIGHLGDLIKEFFASSVTEKKEIGISDKDGALVISDARENWTVTLVETGLDTKTGARLRKVSQHLEAEDDFCVTYGDGLADVDIKSLISFHRKRARIGTLTAVKPFSSFGVLDIDDGDFVNEFREKPQIDEWINGGFFVFDNRIFDYLDDSSTLETTPLRTLAKQNQLVAYKHDGFWKCMDTYKDNLEFNKLWRDDNAQWKVW